MIKGNKRYSKEEGWVDITDTERSCREDGWIYADELLDGPYPILVSAFMLCNPEAWQEFEDDLAEPSGLRFFNTEDCEFDSAETWEELAEKRGVLVRKEDFAIPMELPAHFRYALRELLSYVAEYNGRPPWSGGCKAFHTTAEMRAKGFDVNDATLFSIIHDGGDLAPFFNMDYQEYKAYDMMDRIFRLREIYAEAINCTQTNVYPTS